MAECLRSGDRLKNFPWPWGFQVVLIPETPTWWTGAMHSHRLQQQFWKWQPCRMWMLSFPCAAAADTMTLKQSFCHKHFVILLHIQLLVSRGIWKGSETWSITQKSKKIRYETFLLIGFRCKVHKVNLQSQSKAESYFFKAPRAYQIQRKAMGFYRKRDADRLAVGASHGMTFFTHLTELKMRLGVSQKSLRDFFTWVWMADHRRYIFQLLEIWLIATYPSYFISIVFCYFFDYTCSFIRNCALFQDARTDIKVFECFFYLLNHYPSIPNAHTTSSTNSSTRYQAALLFPTTIHLQRHDRLSI